MAGIDIQGPHHTADQCDVVVLRSLKLVKAQRWFPPGHPISAFSVTAELRMSTGIQLPLPNVEVPRLVIHAIAIAVLKHAVVA